MSICIVGGSGFIGTPLCKRLAADPRVGPHRLCHVALQDALAHTVQHEFLESHVGEAEYFSE